MANVVIAGTATGATALPVASTIDGTNDYIPIYTSSLTATQGINRSTYLGVTGQPADISSTQTFTNKTLGPTNIFNVQDSTFTILDNVDATKKAQFQLASITTGTTRTFTLPDVSDTIVTLTATQTLTNKTLTSPTITAPTITNATISTDAITGFTSSTGLTIAGISITSSVITTAGSVGANANVTNGVQAAALATNAITLGYAQIVTAGTVASATRGALSNPLQVTVTIPAGSRNVQATFQGVVQTSGAAGTTITLAIMDGATCVGQVLVNNAATNYAIPINLVAFISAPVAGSKTYSVQAASSTGTVTVNAGSVNPAVAAFGPAFILVKVI